MKVLVEYLKEFQSLFDWYFQLTQIKRTHLNYWIVIAFFIYLAYKNDAQHRENYTALFVRIDAVNTARAKDQKEYAKSLQIYFDKVTSLLEKSLQQKEEIEQIKEKQ